MATLIPDANAGAAPFSVGDMVSLKNARTARQLQVVAIRDGHFILADGISGGTIGGAFADDLVLVS